MAGKKSNSITSISDNFGSVQSNVGKNGRSDDQTLTLRGKGTPGKTINIYDGNKLIGSTTVNKNGRWKFITEPLDHGQHNFVIGTVRADGSVFGKSSKYKVFVDLSANKLNNIDISEDKENYLIKGRAEAFATVRIYDNGNLIGEVKANKRGFYRFEMDGNMPDGDHAITLTQQDIAGNISQHSEAKTISMGQPNSSANLQKPTVDSGEFDGHTLVITGTVNLQNVESFTVQINGQSYSSEDGLSVVGNKWSLVVDASTWAAGDYEVIATVSNSTGSLQDDSNKEIKYQIENIGLAGIDSDGDEVPDDIDIDDDNDGILDIVEGSGDLDKDGIINALDLDSDGDGIADNIEAQTTNGFKDPIVFIDMDFDGLHDFYDANVGDQTAAASKGITAEDTDNDRLADYLDLDSDNDSLLDINESGVPFDNFSTDYKNITGGYLPDDLADTFGTDERDYRETNAPNNKSIGPIKDIDASFNEIEENASQGSGVGIQARAIDPDSGDTVSYELTDDAQGRFVIDASSGVISVSGGLDHDLNSSHEVTVRANSSDGSFSTKTFTIQVLDDNAPIGPVSDIDSASNSVSETASTGSEVGVTGFAEDPDPSDKVSYTLFDDADGRFNINSKTGVVTLAKELDYSVATSHDITIKAESTDGTVSAETFTIEVEQNKPIGPIKDTDKMDNAVSECSLEDTYVGITALAIDPDTAGNVKYELLDDAGGRFRIDSKTGEVFTTDIHLDYETDKSHTIEIKATSPDGSSSQETMTIDVIDEETFVKFDPMGTYDAGPALGIGWNSYKSGPAVGAVVTVSGTSNLPPGTVLHIKEFNSMFRDEKAAYDESWDRNKTQYHTAVVQADGTFSTEVTLADAPPSIKFYTVFGNVVKYFEPDGNSLFSISDIDLPSGAHICDLNTGEERLTITNTAENHNPAQSPLVLDLNGNGVETTNIDQGIKFDINNDGQLEQVGWVSPEDALLVFDINQDGIINNGSELFGEATVLTSGETAEEGFQALSDLDSNNDGVFDQQDQYFDALQLWQDKNQNGISEEGELIGLHEAGVASIDLAATSINEVDNGNYIGLRSGWTDEQGNSHDIDDVWFSLKPLEEAVNTADLLTADNEDVLPEPAGSHINAPSSNKAGADTLFDTGSFDGGQMLRELLANEDVSYCHC
ncbi:cadherin domain-containing protein [uncultured Pseudoteredinibacter sp.]|uniref:cadherin domain-containing protein n=1 Tax=uncultured Pseudoteredinibacter sp. TaxID=1641701 RepID=UPI0026226A1B|nr:cadherin domain-containing protein [uncultured Pseudoteredinibacter sp.]